MLIDIIWMIMIGVLVAFITRALMYPATRIYDPWGVFVLSILGAIIAGLLLPAETIFIAPFVFIGSLLIYFFGAMLLVWMIGLIVLLILPTP